jgi:RNA polymerase sigma-70 factor (ECF subfamily)
MSGELRAREAAEQVARRSYGKLVAYLAARSRDVASAEDALSDAFAAALSDWPQNGIPDRPEAWLMAVARRRAIDAARRRQTAAAGENHVRLITDELDMAAADAGDIPDERLALMFACAHPAIDEAIRAPLILQTILGFDAATIGSAFLAAPAAMGQRLARAKRKIREAGVPFRVPERADIRERLDAVLAAIYATFSEGWTDPAGTEARRRNLAQEAIWLGRLVVSLLPDEPEALGLLALMLHAEARRDARRSPRGDYVPLAEQDTAAWDTGLIDEAERLLLRASRIAFSGEAASGSPKENASNDTHAIGRYQLEAAIQSAHSVRRLSGAADWHAIAQLYDVLLAMTGSPVVAINRAVALAETAGPAAGLAALDALSDDARLADYQPYWAARAGLLARAGDADAADRAYEHAIGLESDPAVRAFLQRCRASLRN